MEPILTSLLNFGIGGCMAAAVLIFGWWHLTKQLPKIIDTFTLELREERRQCAEQHSAVMNELRTVEADLKESRHAIQDLTNTLKIKAAYEQAKAQQP